MARLWSALLSLSLGWLAGAPHVAHAQASASTSVRDCVRYDERPPDMFDQDAFRKALKTWCRRN